MTTPSISRRECLVRFSAAAVGGWVLAARSSAVPPPKFTRWSTVVLLSADDLKPIHKLFEQASERASPVRTPAFSPDGKLVACGGYTCGEVWETATGKSAGKAGGCFALAFRPTGEVVTAVLDGFTLYNEPDFALCNEWSRDRKEPTTLFKYRLEKATFSSDGRFLAGRKVLNRDGKNRGLQVLTVPDGKEHAALPDDRACFAVSPDATRVISGTWPTKVGGSWTIRAWDVKAAKVVAEVEGQPLERSTMQSRLVTSPDGKLVGLLSPDLKQLVIWDPAARTTTEITHGHGELSAIGFSPDGKRVATAGPKTLRSGDFGLSSSKGPQVVTVWDLAKKRQLVSAEVGDVRFGWLTFSPDGKQLLAAGSEDVEGFGPPPPPPVGPKKE